MKHLLLILLCFALAQNANGQDSTLAKFLMIGHAYGSQDTTVPQWKSILANKQKLINAKADFAIFLGDILRDSHWKTYELFKDSIGFLKSYSIVLGNHDKILQGSFEAQATYGKAIYQTQIENPLFGLNHGEFLKEYQSDYYYTIYEINTEKQDQNLDSLIKSVVKNCPTKNIVFLSHRLIWAYSNPRYAHLAKLTNSEAMHLLPQAVDLDFLNQQKGKKFYFFAGDLGLRIPLFYNKVGNVTMYATGCGGTAKDNALLAEFKRDTIITSLVHLGTAQYNIEDYTLEKINNMPAPNETISAQQGFKGYQWPVVLGIFALMALALYMVVTPNE